jgi:signal transduction histidine kinase/tetratricopeptide (TPR) repeat protein
MLIVGNYLHLLLFDNIIMDHSILGFKFNNLITYAMLRPKTPLLLTCRSVFLAAVLFFCSPVHAQTQKSTLQKIEALKSQKDFSEKQPEYIDLLFDLAKNLMFENKDTMLLLINQGLDLSIASNYKKGEGYAYLGFGDYYSLTSNSAKGKEYYNKALDISVPNSYDKLTTTTLNSFGLTLYEEGDFAAALTYYLRGIELGEQMKNPQILAVLYDNVAIMYTGLEDFETSLYFHNKAMEVSELNGKEVYVAKTLSNMAFAYTKMGDYEKAEGPLNKAINIFTESDVLDWLSFCYEVKGYKAQKNEKFKEALDWYIKSKELCDKLNYITGSIGTHNGLARAYLGLGQIDLAEENALLAHKMGEEANFPEGIVISNFILSKIYRIKKNYSKALDYQDNYIKIYKETETNNFKRGLGLLRSEQKFKEEKEKLLAEKNKEINRNRNLAYTAAASIFILILVILLGYKNYRNQQRFNGILQKNQIILSQRETELRETNKTKDKLFSLIAHDLRGPINSFYDLMHFYINGNLTKQDFDNFLPKALKEIKAITEMLNQLLSWSKTQIGGSTHNPTNVSIYELTNKNVELLRPLSAKKALTITNRIPPSLKAYCDYDHVDIVLRNLISNAIKFTHNEGNIILSAAEKERFVQIGVKDDGVGLDTETKENILKKNSYYSTFGTHKEKGTGLGLSLSQEMIEINGGKIWVNSTPEQGTTFYFTLPLKKTIKETV